MFPGSHSVGGRTADLAPEKGALQLALPGPGERQPPPVEKVEKDPLPLLFHKEGGGKSVPLRHPGPHRGTSAVVEEYRRARRRRAASGAAGQHPGTLAPSVSQSQPALCSQGPAQGHQQLRTQFLLQRAPYHAAVSKTGAPRPAAADQRGREPCPLRDLSPRPDLDPFHEDAVLPRHALGSQHRALVEDGSGLCRGAAAQDGAVQRAAFRDFGIFHQDTALDQTPPADEGSRPYHGMGAQEAPLFNRGPRPDPAGRHHRDPTGQLLRRPDAGAPLGKSHIHRHLAPQRVGGTGQIGAAVPHIAPIAIRYVPI